LLCSPLFSRFEILRLRKQQKKLKLMFSYLRYILKSVPVSIGLQPNQNYQYLSAQCLLNVSYMTLMKILQWR
jgi:hypothetical protein